MPSSTARIFYITGKGGVGKSLVTRTLAAAGTKRGLRTALVEFAEATANSPSSTPSAGVTRIVIDHQRALQHVLSKLLRFRFLSQRLLDSRTFSAITAAAPGIKDLVYLSWLSDLACGATDDNPRFDLIFVDGLASGHSLPLLAAPTRIRDLAAVGPAGRIAREADRLVRGDNGLRVVIVTSPEELAVIETLNLFGQLREIGVSLTPAVINSLYPELARPSQGRWLADHPEVSPDAKLYLARYQRQTKLVARIEKHMGSAATLPMCFVGAPPPAAAAAALLDTLLGCDAAVSQHEGTRG